MPYVLALEMKKIILGCMVWILQGDYYNLSLKGSLAMKACLLGYEATTKLKEPLISKVGLTPQIKNVPNIIKLNPNSSPYLLPLL